MRNTRYTYRVEPTTPRPPLRPVASSKQPKPQVKPPNKTEDFALGDQVHPEEPDK